MAKIENTEVYGLNKSFRASKYPMAIDTTDVDDTYTERIGKLAKCDIGTGHDNFLNGIIVQFDLTFSNKAWVEAERYHFLDFVSSQSTMHRITKMNIKKQCNEYVDDCVIDNLQKRVAEYNAEPSDEKFYKVIYNIPSGFELTARMTTNYRQLKTIYTQRKTHRLPDWHMFCKWVKTLPMAKELIIGVEE